MRTAILLMLACGACATAKPHPSEPLFRALLSADKTEEAVRLAKEAKLPLTSRRAVFDGLLERNAYEEALSAATVLDLPHADMRRVFLACVEDENVDCALSTARQIGLPYAEVQPVLRAHVAYVLEYGQAREALETAYRHGMPRTERLEMAAAAYDQALIAKECDRATDIAASFGLGGRRLTRAVDCMVEADGHIKAAETVCGHDGVRDTAARLLNEAVARYDSGDTESPGAPVTPSELEEVYQSCHASRDDWRNLYAHAMRKRDYEFGAGLIARTEFAANEDEQLAFVRQAVAPGGNCNAVFAYVLSNDVPNTVVQQAFAAPLCAGSSTREQSAYVAKDRETWLFLLAIEYKHARLAYGIALKFEMTGGVYAAFRCAMDDGDYYAALDISLPALETQAQVEMVFQEALSSGDAWFVASHAAQALTTDKAFSRPDKWIDKAYETAFTAKDYEGAALIASKFGDAAVVGPRIRACYSAAFKAKDYRTARALHTRFSSDDAFMATKQAFTDADLKRLALAEFRSRYPEQAPKRKEGPPTCPEGEDPNDWRPERCR